MIWGTLHFQKGTFNRFRGTSYNFKRHTVLATSGKTSGKRYECALRAHSYLFPDGSLTDRSRPYWIASVVYCIQILFMNHRIRGKKRTNTTIRDTLNVNIVNGCQSAGLETNWNHPLASRASDLENLLALLNSTSPDFFVTPICCCAYHSKY